jgi:hypothetical protein
MQCDFTMDNTIDVGEIQNWAEKYDSKRPFLPLYHHAQK